MSILPVDYPYSKNIKTFKIEKGARQEIRERSQLKGTVVIRIATSNPISVQIAGPHTEMTEVRGSREFSFDIEPETEFVIGLQAPSGVFAKPAEVTAETIMKGSKRALTVLEKVRNLTTMLRENPEFFDLQKGSVQAVLEQVIEVWGHYGDEAKRLVKELMGTAKKLEPLGI